MEKAIVFGCSIFAKRNWEKICERFDIAAYADNDPALWGKEWDGLPVIPPDQISKGMTVIVATRPLYSMEIVKQLMDMGIEDIFVLVKKDIIRYTAANGRADALEFEYPHREPLLTRLQLGFSSTCNSKCQYCKFFSEYSDRTLPRGLMSEEVLDAIIRQIRPVDSLKSLNLVGSGEPLLHPRWMEFATSVLNAQPSFEECTLYTNGMLLTEENAVKLKQLPVQRLKLVLSIDGVSPEDCEYWRKGERFSVIRENVNRAYELLGQRVEFTVSGCVVLPKEVDPQSAFAVETFLKKSGEWRQQEFPFAKHSNKAVFPLVKHIPGTKAVLGATWPRVSRCTNPFSHIVVYANGDILSCPCSYTFEDEQHYIIGNVLRDNLEEIFYKSETMRMMRGDLLRSRKPPLCEKCWMLGGSSVFCLQKTEEEQ